MRFLLSFVILLALALLGGAVLVWTGAYDFAASRPHWPLTEEIIDFAVKRSVAVRADQIAVPPLTDAAMARDGAGHYREMCQACHGGPGQQPLEFTKGLTPHPPDLEKAVPHWSAAELFWIVKHGIKPSGMPAWGEIDSDQELWKIVAFLQRLPGMPPEQYRQLAEGGGHHHGTAEAGAPEAGAPEAAGPAP